jgi:cytochrome b6-f complex iron-sulfur subunit
MLALLRTTVGWALATVIGLVGIVLARLHEAPGTPRVTRRTFLRNVVLGSTAVVLAEITAGFVWFFWPNKTGAFGKEISVPQDQIPAVGAAPYVNQAGKFYIINNDDGALALYWKCVHLGCTVPWNDGEGEFHCPCHGSIYDRHGVLIAGPAPRPLDLMGMTQNADGTVIVDTGDIRERSGYSPEQSVKLTTG